MGPVLSTALVTERIGPKGEQRGIRSGSNDNCFNDTPVFARAQKWFGNDQIGTAFAAVTVVILLLNSCPLDGAESPAARNPPLTVPGLQTNSSGVFFCLDLRAP